MHAAVTELTTPLLKPSGFDSPSIPEQRFPDVCFFFFLSYSYHIQHRKADVVLGCVWLVAREEDVESGGEERGSAFMRSTVEQAASLCLMSAGLHRS